jgi:hypothetical protein
MSADLNRTFPAAEVAWFEKNLDQIFRGDDKLRYLRAQSPETISEIAEACAYWSWARSESLRNPPADAAKALHGWLNEDTPMTRANRVLNRRHISKPELIPSWEVACESI